MQQLSIFEDNNDNLNIYTIMNKWHSILPEKDINYAIKLFNKVNKMRKNTIIYPDKDDIFKVFKELSPEKVKVIIIGQDPYHDGNATGFAFACKNSISPSLRHIWNSIKSTTEEEYGKKITPRLEHLLEQGVFAINTTLTVEQGKPLSHKYLNWEYFIASVIYNLNRTKNNLVFMLWGSHAKKFSKYINNDRHLELVATHPVYASYQGTKWNCDHFIKCNEYLKEHNIETIKWR